MTEGKMLKAQIILRRGLLLSPPQQEQPAPSLNPRKELNMKMHSIVDNVLIAQPVNPQTILASALNTGNIDMQGAETLAVVTLVGNIADTLDSTHRIDLKIEHADDDGTGNPGTYAACVDDDVLNFTGLVSGVFVSIDAAGKKQKRHVISYRGGRRFVKVTATPVGLVTGGPIAVLTLKGNTNQRPVVNT